MGHLLRICILIFLGLQITGFELTAVTEYIFFIELIFGQDSTSIEDQFKQTELINRKNEINWLKELGYVSLMETSFLGFSYLSKGNKGKYIVSVFDLFIGMAGLSSNPNKSQKNYQFGYNLISTWTLD